VVAEAAVAEAAVVAEAAEAAVVAEVAERYYKTKQRKTRPPDEICPPPLPESSQVHSHRGALKKQLFLTY
jgi:hypothetical protein